MDKEQLRAAIAAQESLRGIVGDEVVDTTLAALHQQLAKLDGSDRQRRQATVLFADVSGFTAMSEMLDAEDVSDVMNLVWERLDAVVASHRGRIDKHIGDALMAIWGVGATSEDHPEQAIRAALGLQQAMSDFRAETSIELRIRVGVNTGPALLGRVGSQGEFTAMGDTVNLASRLEHAAPIDGVLISHNTYRHVKGVFTVHPRTPLDVKGKVRPVRSYLVDSVRPRAFRLGTRGVEGVETEMVGRDAELNQLQALLSQTVDDGTSRSVTVVGEAGLGKSRLLYEFEDWLRLQPTEVRLFKARADQQHLGDPHFLIRDLLFSRFEIADDDSPRTAHRKLESGLRDLAPDTDARDVELLASLVGIELDGPPDGPSGAALLREQTHTAFGVFMRRVSDEMPVVLLLEDLQWSDASSLDAIESMMSRCASSPLFRLQLARPVALERYCPDWGSKSVRIDLEPLEQSTMRRLLEDVLQNVEFVPEAALAQLTTIAAGNPFFAEELVKVMIDNDTIVTDNDEWKLDSGRLERLQPPSTVAGVLNSRIDHLSPAERVVLERAAVVGRTFWEDAVENAGGRAEPAHDLSGLLASLEAKELVFRQSTSSFAGTRQFIFKHALLHDVAYDRILKSDRSLMHRSIAEWHIGRGETASSSATIASHYDAAGSPEDASLWHARAGRHAARHFALQDALTHLTTALRSPGLDPETRFWAVETLSHTLSVLGRHLEALEATNDNYALAVELEDPARQAEALMQRSHLFVRLGRLDQALAACEQAEVLIDPEGAEPEINIQVQTEKGWTLLRLGRSQEALEAGSIALSQVSDRTKLRFTRGVHSQLGATQHAIGNLAAAETHLQEALRLDRQRHHPRNEAGDLINLGVLASSRHAHELAIDRFETALRITREIGDLDQEALALNNLGGERVSLGQYREATLQLEEALRLFDAARAAEHTSETHCLLACAQLGLGEFERATAEAQAALEIGEQSGSAEHLGKAWLALGAIARLSHRLEVDPDESDQCLERGTELLTSAALETDLANKLRLVADISHDLGNVAAAHDLHERADAISQ